MILVLPGEHVKVHIRDLNNRTDYDCYFLVSAVHKGVIEVFYSDSPTGFAKIVYISSSKETGKYWFEYTLYSADVDRLENKDGIQLIGLENFFDTTTQQ